MKKKIFAGALAASAIAAAAVAGYVRMRRSKSEQIQQEHAAVGD